jgi:hypothetical protein
MNESQYPVGRAQLSTPWTIKRLSGVFLRWTLLITLFVALVALPRGVAKTGAERVVLPVEVLSAEGAPESRTVALQFGDAELVASLWLQVHGVRYANQASVQVNTNPWIPLNNETAAIAEPGRSFGGIGGGFATLSITVPLPSGTVISGANTVRFRFNQTDGFTSAYRVLAWNFLTADGKKIIPAETFVEDRVETWTPPISDAASLRHGKELWQSASLAANSLPNSPRIHAHCADCHAQDGRDLKYFNFSNASIVDRSRFHGLSVLEGRQIASYIRSLPFPNPGRPWNPPYQPGPGLDEQPASNWAAGSGLEWVLDRDMDALPYLFAGRDAKAGSCAANPKGESASLGEIATLITPEIFRPDGNLNAHEIPIALQLPDWSQWLPRVHPKDAWGATFTQSEFAAFYENDTAPKGRAGARPKLTLRALLTTPSNEQDVRALIPAFAEWSQARRAFLKRAAEKTPWSRDLTEKVYSTQLWQLVKTWELSQEFGLEGRARDVYGPTADSRSWLNTVPADTAPSAVNIPDGPAGVGGSALTNEYLSASWYELQILLNSGNHQHRNRGPVDWVYVIGRFHDLYSQTHQPEPTRLLVAVIKALQSSDPRIGPDNFNQGWRPDQNVDPRILISSAWAPFFKPFPPETHQALASALLTAWMDKNLQYPIEKHLPMGQHANAYQLPREYTDISGGKVWESSQQFRDAGVSPDAVRRLQQWGLAYKDRASRIQY